MNKQSNVSSNSTVHAIQVDTQAQLVTIEAGIEGWAVYGRRNAVDGILATLSVVFNPPDVRAIAHTAFELKRSRFLTVEPNKRKKIFIRRPHGQNFSFSCSVSFSCGLTDHSVFVRERSERTEVNSCRYDRKKPSDLQRITYYIQCAVIKKAPSVLYATRRISRNNN